MCAYYQHLGIYLIEFGRVLLDITVLLDWQRVWAFINYYYSHDFNSLLISFALSFFIHRCTFSVTDFQLIHNILKDIFIVSLDENFLVY